MGAFNFKRVIFPAALVIVGLVFASPGRVWGENGGLKYFQNFAPQDYDHLPQNWSILQDKRGVVYVGNQGGLLEFDGVSWRIIYGPNKTVRSIATDGSGTIYIGGNNEIGFLTPDSRGALHYDSLLKYLDGGKRDFSNVWRINVAHEKIYFRTSKFLFRWDSRQMKVWESDYGFRASFTCGGKLFVHQAKVGLFQMIGDSLKLIPGGDLFAGKRIYVMAPCDEQRILIGTRANGFYFFDGSRVAPFPIEIGGYLEEKKLSYGIRLSNGDFALATLRGGLVIMNPKGGLKQVFTKAYGLVDDNVKYVFEDFQGNLWLALDKGIAKIEYTSPIATYDDRTNLPGHVLSVARHGPHRDLYAGTTRGLFSLPSVGADKFIPVPGMTSSCWSLVSTGDSLLAATTAGVFRIGHPSKPGQRIVEDNSYVLHRSRQKPHRIWVGTRRGLVSLLLEKERWRREHKFEDITEEIRTIGEDKRGNLWLGTLSKGVLRVDFPADGPLDDPVLTRYDGSHGLPSEEVHVFTASGRVMFASPQEGLFRFDEKDRVFIPDSTLGKEFADGSSGVFRIAEDKNQDIWLHSRGRNIQAIPGVEGSYVLNKKPFLRIPVGGANAIYPDPFGDVAWFAGNYGLVRYDTGVKKNCDLKFAALIREVVINGVPLVYDAGESKYRTGKDESGQDVLPVIPYRDRNLRFEFAAPFFEAESATRYQYRLEGYDEDWSAWTSETRKDYTNLGSGRLKFRVRAQNVYGNVSEEAVFSFRVLPPWYQTWWAFSVYALLFLLVMYLTIRWRSGKLEQEKQRLEQIVKERTKEIKEQSKKLKEMDEVKSRFFANISHEFRTPLTLIMGPMEKMLSTCTDREQQKILDMMLRNSQRLLGLINQLLDLSRLDSGSQRLQAGRLDIVAFLKGILASFELLAAENRLDLTFSPGEEDIELYFDPEKLEEALCNLLVNAVKFTPPGGKISVSLRVAGEPAPGNLEISVADTGIGIPRDRLDYIFDRFYQVEGLGEHKHKGSGIGLALTKELVILHGGEITVDSWEGEGTEFIVRLPLGKGHLDPGKIVGRPPEPFEPRGPGEISALYAMDKGEEAAEKPGEKFEAPGEEKNIILVVEDNTDMRSYIRGALEPLYRVTEAKDGEEGIKTAREIIPDLVISDIMMPGSDGYELCRVLKQDVTTSHIPIILLTARVSEEDVVQGLETGADDYITKPFSTKILCARVKNLIELRRQLQAAFDREMTRQSPKLPVSGVDKDFIKDLQAVIDENLSDPDFNVEELVKKLYMGRTTLYRKLQALSGASPTDFIKSYRLQRAAELLKNKAGSITEVAFQVGFSSRTYFTKCFKEKFHKLPSDYAASEAD